VQALPGLPSTCRVAAGPTSAPLLRRAGLGRGGLEDEAGGPVSPGPLAPGSLPGLGHLRAEDGGGSLSLSINGSGWIVLIKQGRKLVLWSGLEGRHARDKVEFVKVFGGEGCLIHEIREPF